MRLPTSAALRMLLGTTMALAVSAALAMPAAAHGGGTATGAFTFLSDTKTPIGQAGGNVFIHEVASISYTGGLTGIADADDIVIVHSDGSVTGYGTETCHSCTIGGRTGSFTAVFAFHGSSHRDHREGDLRQCIRRTRGPARRRSVPGRPCGQHVLVRLSVHAGPAAPVADLRNRGRVPAKDCRHLAVMRKSHGEMSRSPVTAGQRHGRPEQAVVWISAPVVSTGSESAQVQPRTAAALAAAHAAKGTARATQVSTPVLPLLRASTPTMLLLRRECEDVDRPFPGAAKRTI